ncbi:MAG: acetyl-CoA carboxylase carboxyltransferase subunit alpha [Capsulimonadales bacterium]|nr:acetyl-CoA carboxylase carboxyltransferase subunit alpha [Capsulimonadales bacterium]
MENLNVLEFEQQLAELDKTLENLDRAAARENRPDAAAEARKIREERDAYLRLFFERLQPWDRVLLARHKDRPYTLDYVPLLTESFTELSGDRLFGDDGALVGGFASIAGRSVLLIGQQKGRDIKERQKRNFGYVRPEGYRKALRLMQMAARFTRPIVSLVDTPGADPNVPSEERGISEAIARNLREMAALRTPTLAVVIGEGGSGGALGIAVCDRVLMLEHSIYSVIAPEGCAAILWRDSTRGADAAKAMRVTAKDALTLGLIDEVIPEPLGGAHRGAEATAAAVRDAVTRHLDELTALPIPELLKRRHARLRSFGRVQEIAVSVK